MTAEGADAKTTRVVDTAVAREAAQLWPNLFGVGVFVPLETGIDKTLAMDAQRRGSALTRAKIRLFVGWHVRRSQYLEALRQRGLRQSVNGAAEGNGRAVITADAAHAQEKVQTMAGSQDATSADDPDGEEGMDWWNALDRRERAKWMKAGGDTGVPADAWNAFKVALSTLGDQAGARLSSRVNGSASSEAAGSVDLLQPAERLFYRDRFRSARYAALADAEGFEAICFALEALGLRLAGQKEALGTYGHKIVLLARSAHAFAELPSQFPLLFKSFEGLFSIVREARNDAMHTGSYARHATQAAIELCIGLEEALMVGVDPLVQNLMVSSPVSVESWQPLAHARQLMLMHSFSFLPVRLGDAWCLVSELGLAKYLKEHKGNSRWAESIATARSRGMEVREIADDELLRPGMNAIDVLARASVRDGPMLWLVVDDRRPDYLAGVLSPFELM